MTTYINAMAKLQNCYITTFYVLMSCIKVSIKLSDTSNSKRSNINKSMCVCEYSKHLIRQAAINYHNGTINLNFLH